MTSRVHAPIFAESEGQRLFCAEHPAEVGKRSFWAVIEAGERRRDRSFGAIHRKSLACNTRIVLCTLPIKNCCRTSAWET